MGGDRFVAVRAWQHNGVSYVDPLLISEYEDDLWEALEAAYPTIDTLAITPTLEPHLDPSLKRKSKVVGINELSRATPLVRSMISVGQVAHSGNLILDEHVGRAVATRHAGISTAHSGPVECARTMVWAVALASRPQNRSKPSIGYSEG
jgi:hypothetical protein